MTETSYTAQISAARKELEEDPDIKLESKHFDDFGSSGIQHQVPAEEKDSPPASFHYRLIPLNLEGNTFRGNHQTAELLQEIGGEYCTVQCRIVP